VVKPMSKSCLRLAALLLPLAAIGACSPGVSGTASGNPAASDQALPRHPESGLPIIPLTIQSSGKTHAFRVEVAESRAEQAKGLMFRRSMGANEGMLFPFDAPREASFWMKNTVIPLDIIFIGADQRILNIEAEAVPYSEAPRSSQGKAAAVLELIGGRAAQLGIGAGDKVEFQSAKRLAPMAAAE